MLKVKFPIFGGIIITILCEGMSNFTTRKSFRRKTKGKKIIVRSIHPSLRLESKIIQ